MKIISSGNGVFDVYGDGLKVYNELPVDTYVVRFSQNRGFYLEKYLELEIKEEKIYGSHEEKTKKVLNAFKKFNKNLGVILSGDKGIGKSLFSKVLAMKAMSNNIPVVIVDKYYSGIAEFLTSIEQEVLVLFDEYDKTFDVKKADGEANSNAEMLTLFDGISPGKKLFVITCNEIHGMSNFLINRPGRFHYHFRFDYPNAEEAREYLMDKIDEQEQHQIEDIIKFFLKKKLNYDSLGAIAFEINEGIPFGEAIKDLNILNTDKDDFCLIMRFKGTDKTLVDDGYSWITMFGDEENTLNLCESNREGSLAYISFAGKDVKVDSKNGKMFLPIERVHDFSWNSREDADKYKNLAIDSIEFVRKETNRFFFSV